MNETPDDIPLDQNLNIDERIQLNRWSLKNVENSPE